MKEKKIKKLIAALRKKDSYLFTAKDSVEAKSKFRKLGITISDYRDLRESRQLKVAVASNGQMYDVRIDASHGCILHVYRHNAEKAQAIERLIELGKKAVPALCDEARNGEPRMREHAIYLLGKIGDVKAVKTIKMALSDRSVSNRHWAIWALGIMKVADAVELLIPFLSAPDAELRLWASWALGKIKIGGQEVTDALRYALRDEDEHVRFWSASALAELGDEKAMHTLEGFFRDRRKYFRVSAVNALTEFGMRALPALKKHHVGGGDAYSGETARNATSVIIEKLDIPQLIEVMRDDVMGGQAEKRLVKSGPAALPNLILLLKDKDASIRRKAIKLIVQIGEKASSAISTLIELLDDRNAGIRLDTSRALGQFGEAASLAVPALKRLLLTDSEDVSREAAESLGKILGLSALPYLYEATIRRPKMQEDLMQTIYEIAGNSTRDMGARREEVKPQLGPVAHLFHPRALDVGPSKAHMKAVAR